MDSFSHTCPHIPFTPFRYVSPCSFLPCHRVMHQPPALIIIPYCIEAQISECPDCVTPSPHLLDIVSLLGQTLRIQVFFIIISV
ncbi:hypothetical protein BJ165DRAFT_1514992 [Panaeolus papilionaceus]|nr:hypothetical protein BJ165DRAFT_1514992 [Panaeolus papilionaceus]